MTFKEFAEDWIRHGRDLAYTLEKVRRLDLMPSVHDLKKQKDKVFRANMADRVVLMPGATQAIGALSGEFILAVDSSSAMEDTKLLLHHFEIDRFFAMIGSADMPWDNERYGKNNKSSRFRCIADSLCSRPEDCVVVGDAEKDMLAAKDAGIAVIIIPSQTTKYDNFTLADLVLPSLAELTCVTIHEVRGK